MQSNPFATRFVAPGRIPWLSQSADQHVGFLRDRFVNQLQRRAAIVGPHGSGKSTLLEHLLPSLGPICFRQTAVESVRCVPCARGIVWLQLRPEKRPAIQVLRSCGLWTADGVLVLDGFEQLSGVARRLVLLATASYKMGLLVTAHAENRIGGLPILYRTRVDAEAASRMVRDLLSGHPMTGELAARLADPDELGRRLNRLDGNFREVLMELFDEAQETRFGTGAATD